MGGWSCDVNKDDYLEHAFQVSIQSGTYPGSLSPLLAASIVAHGTMVGPGWVQ